MTTDSRKISRASFLFPSLSKKLADLLQLFLADLLVFHQVDQQRLGRSVENALYEIVHQISDHFTLGLSGSVDVSAVIRAPFQTSLLFEYPHHGHHRGVSDLAALEQLLVNVSDRDTASLPYDLHDFKL